ncbi:MAG: hypothetical protein LQ346_007207 [Caloplaca aetnensis]|nr:MAG: hypothetical protein LQ346_007207 [Caloplaca aetnensis]
MDPELQDTVACDNDTIEVPGDGEGDAASLDGTALAWTGVVTVPELAVEAQLDAKELITDVWPENAGTPGAVYVSVQLEEEEAPPVEDADGPGSWLRIMPVDVRVPVVDVVTALVLMDVPEELGLGLGAAGEDEGFVDDRMLVDPLDLAGGGAELDDAGVGATTKGEELLLKPTRRDKVALEPVEADAHEDPDAQDEAVIVLYEVTEDCVQLQEVALPSGPIVMLLELP